MKPSITARIFVLICATALLWGVSPAHAQADGGQITGRVIAAHNGRPVHRAQVTLTAVATKSTRIGHTDRDGWYTFDNVAAGRYSVSVAKDGFVELGFGHPRELRSVKGVDVIDGQSVDRIDFSLARGSVITGRVTDEFGDPIAGVGVNAARFEYAPSGRRQLGSSRVIPGSIASSMTNDLGEYRIFGLLPGRYMVSARVVFGVVNTPATVSYVDSRDIQATTYYPGTNVAADAQAVSLGLMQEVSASFSIVPTRTVQLAGTVVDSRGSRAPNGRITLRLPDGEVKAYLPVISGRFALGNVDPGSYILEVVLTEPGARGDRAIAREFASVPLSVSERDMANLLILTRPGTSVSGRVVLEGEAAKLRETIRIAAMSEHDARNFISWNSDENASIDADGRFVLANVHGRVAFRTNTLPPTMVLKSVTLRGVDITNRIVDADAVGDISDLEIVVSGQAGGLVGHIRDHRGEPMVDCRLITYPAHPREDEIPIRFMHNASPNQSGRFQIGRMPAGEYLAACAEGVVNGQQWDPTLRKRIEQSGRRFRLDDGETLEIDLPFLPATTER